MLPVINTKLPPYWFRTIPFLNPHESSMIKRQAWHSCPNPAFWLTGSAAHQPDHGLHIPRTPDQARVVVTTSRHHRDHRNITTYMAPKRKYGAVPVGYGHSYIKAQG